MRRSIMVSLAVGCLLGQPLWGRADEPPRVIHITTDAIPQRLLVRRGTTVEFSGTLPEDSMPVTFTVRAGTVARATGSFQGKWRLVWDSTREPGATCYLSLWRADAGRPETRLGRITVEMADQAPFLLAQPTADASTDGPLEVQVASPGGTRLTGGAVLVDGKAIGQGLDAKGHTTVDLAGLKPGFHLLVVRVRADGGGDFDTDPVRVTLRSTIKLTRDEVGPVDLRSGGVSAIPLHVTVPPSLKPVSADFFLDGKPFGHSTTPPFDDVTLPTKGLTSGLYTVSCEVAMQDGTRHASADLQLEVMGDSKGEFTAWHRGLERMLASAEAAYQSFADALARYRAGRQEGLTAAEVTIALNKLIASDVYTSEHLADLGVPRSLSPRDANDVRNALQECQIAFSNRLRVGRRALLIIKRAEGTTGVGERETAITDAATSFGEFELALAGAKERVAAVEERVMSAGQPAERRETGAKWTGQPGPDFLLWRQRLQAIFDETAAALASYVRRNDYTTGEANLALRKLGACDTTAGEALDKMAPPPSLGDADRNTLRNVCQALAQAYRYRSQADRAELRELQARTSVPNPSGRATRPLTTNIRQMWARYELETRTALEKVDAVSRKLGGSP